MERIEKIINKALQEAEDLEERNEAIIYASKKLNYTNSKIAKLTQLAISTVKVYVKKFKDLLEKAIARFENILKRYIEKPATYIVEFYKNKERTEKLNLKVGTTARTMDTREKELIRKYKKTYNVDNLYPVVKKIYFFKEKDDAEAFESALRAFYKNKENAKFIPKDRFENVSFNEEELNTNQKLNALLSLLSFIPA